MADWYCSMDFGVPAAKPAYDVIAALFLRHIVDLDNLFER